MWLITGLGNPGPSYAAHRHNIGFRVADELADRVGARFRAPTRMRADVAEGRLGAPGPESTRAVLLKPRTFMNDSGGAVSNACRYYQITPDRLVAIHDELDLDLGTLRVKYGGGDNGHNGLKSMRSSLSTGDYFRVRFGVGRPAGRQDPAAFVLSNFSRRERDEVEIGIRRAADAVESLINSGLSYTQEQFNS